MMFTRSAAPAAVPAPSVNIYDEQGTVLYRVLPRAAYAEEAAGDQPPLSITAGADNAHSTNMNRMNHNNLTDPTTSSSGAAAAAATLNPITTPATMAGLQNPRAVLEALEVIFPPVSLDETPPFHTATTVPTLSTRHPTQVNTNHFNNNHNNSINSFNNSTQTGHGFLQNSVKGVRGSNGPSPGCGPGLLSSTTSFPAAPNSTTRTTVVGGAATGPTGRGWIQVAARDHAGRADVVALLEHLKRRCAQESARPRGTLCRLRERIFDDAMRELTRQITVHSPERGLLLHELGEQMAQSTETYKVLYESACQYAVRKSTERDLRRHLFVEKEDLEREARRVENRVNELQAKYDGMRRRFEEQMATARRAHAVEIDYVKRSIQQIVMEIKRLASMESASK